MKILSIDTASDICGVSILENNITLINLDNITGRTHSENLMPMIQEAFNKTNLKLSDIDLIVSNIGPGSFTGLRIGCSTTQAFSDSLSIKTIGVCSLESLVYNISNTGVYVSLISANNSDVYFAMYNKENNVVQNIIPPSLDQIDNALSICTQQIDFSDNIIFVGDSVQEYKEKILNLFPDAILANEAASYLNSSSLALAGLDHFKNNDFQSILPLYLKKPQAQIQLEEKNNKKD